MTQRTDGSSALCDAFRVVFSRPIVMLGLKASLMIGTLLNLINQGDALFGSAEVVVPKVFVTYLVPYCTASYSAASIVLRMRRSARVDP